LRSYPIHLPLILEMRSALMDQAQSSLKLVASLLAVTLLVTPECYHRKLEGPRYLSPLLTALRLGEQHDTSYKAQAREEDDLLQEEIQLAEPHMTVVVAVKDKAPTSQLAEDYHAYIHWNRAGRHIENFTSKLTRTLKLLYYT
jgi:hypothetical protein